MVLGWPDKLVKSRLGFLHGLCSTFCLLFFPLLLLRLGIGAYVYSDVFPHTSWWTLAAQINFICGAISGTVALVALPVWTEMHTTSSEKYLAGMTPTNIQRTHYARIASFVAFSILGAYFSFPNAPRALVFLALIIHVWSSYTWIINKYDPVGVMNDAGGFAIALEVMTLWYGPYLFEAYPVVRSFYMCSISNTCYFFTYAYFFYYLLRRGYVPSPLALCKYIRYVHLGMVFHALFLAAALFLRYGVSAQPPGFWVIPVVSIGWLPIVKRSISHWKYELGGADCKSR
jgi:hypothetical protein